MCCDAGAVLVPVLAGDSAIAIAFDTATPAMPAGAFVTVQISPFGVGEAGGFAKIFGAQY